MMNDSDRASEDSSVVDGSVDFGSILASARKFKSFTVEQVSEQLKIPIRTIVAIEENNVEVLPAPTFTQGYIRAYAKFLEISEDNVLVIYNRAVPHSQATDLKPRSNLPEEASSQSFLMKTVTLLLILAGITAVIYGSVRYYQEKADVMETERESRQRSFTGSSLDSPSSVRVIIKQNARLTDEGELIVSPSVTTKEDDVETDIEAPAEDISEATPEEVIPEQGGFEPGAVMEPEKAVASPDVLEIFAKNGSWMQVRDVSNARLLYNTVPKGEVKVLHGQAPFRISLGNAKTTRVTINDLEIDMSEYIRENNTAKFSVSTDQEKVIFH